MTRDSFVWWLGILFPVIVEGCNAIGVAPSDYGIPAAWVPFFRLVALVVGLVSGKLATSPLPGKPKEPPVEPAG